MKKYFLILALILLMGCQTTKIIPQKAEETKVQRDLILNYTSSGSQCSGRCVKIEIYSNRDFDVDSFWAGKFTKKISKEDMKFIKNELIKSDFFNVQYTVQEDCPAMAGSYYFYFTDGINKREVGGMSCGKSYVPNSVSSLLTKLVYD